MPTELAELKSKILKLLEEDVEFRYAVAGLIGLDEVLKRLDRHEEELKRIWEEIARLREDMVKGFERHDQQIAKLREDMMKGFERHDMELARLREDFNRAIQVFEKRFEEIDRRFDKIEERLDKMNTRLSRVEKTLEKLTLDIEDEARSIVRYRIKNEFGLDMDLKALQLPDLEINIYGCRDDVCVIGEASVRAGISTLEKLENALEILRRKYPDRLKPKTILVIYTSLATPELIEEAKRRGIWVLKATGDIYKPDLTKGVL